MSEVPKDLALWVGLVLFGGLGKWLVDRVFSAPERAQAALAAAQASTATEFRAEVKLRLEQILGALQKTSLDVAKLETGMTVLQGEQKVLAERQTIQAQKHLEAIEKLRSEFEAKLERSR